MGQELSAIPYSSSITVNLVYDESKLGELPEGFGFLVPASEGRAMLACTFVHRKFLGRTPPGKAVSAPFSAASGMKLCSLSPTNSGRHRPPRTERNPRREDVGLDIEPEHAQVSRWRRAMAQYAVGHQERMHASPRRWPLFPVCDWPATPTTASASPIASASAAKPRGIWLHPPPVSPHRLR